MPNAEPLRGEKDLARIVDGGGDPNADLERATDDNDTTQRAESALALRLSGASYTQIAKVIGYASAYNARSAVERVLAQSAESPEERDQMRVLIDRRMNRLLQSVMSKATNPKEPEHLAYNSRALAIIDRQAKLWGVDAPLQVQVTPSDEHIQKYVAEVSRLANADRDAEEADILDADEVEDDD